MERIDRKMGIERLSKDQVSAMCRSIDAQVGELASRDLGEITVPYLLLDATHVKCRRDGHVQSTAVVTAIVVGSTGVRRILSLAAIDTETYAGWLGFLLRQWARRCAPLRQRRPRLPGLPRRAPEAHTHQQRAGAHEQGDKAQVAAGPGLPERRVHGAPGGRRLRRAG